MPEMSPDAHCASGAAELRLVRFRTQGGNDVFFCRRRFLDEGSQGLRGILHQMDADGPFAIYETPDGTFVNAETPREGGRAAEYLNAVGKVLGKILHFG